MYSAAANFRISSSGRMAASIYVPNGVACTGIQRASLTGLLSRLCSFCRQLFGAGGRPLAYKSFAILQE